MATSGNAPRQFTGRHMLIIMLGFFGVVIAVNATLAVIANKTWSGLIVENGYVASQKFNREEARLKEQSLLGWSVAVVPHSDRITVSLRDAAGRPLTGMHVTGMLKRTVTEADDKPLAFAATDAGIYRAATPVAPGKWSLELAARDFQGHEFLQTYHFMVEPGVN